MCTSSIHPQADLHSQPLAYLYFLTFYEKNQQNELSVLLNAALEVRITCTWKLWKRYSVIRKLSTVDPLNTLGPFEPHLHLWAKVALVKQYFLSRKACLGSYKTQNGTELEVIVAQYRCGHWICDRKIILLMSAHQCMESSSRILYQPRRWDKHLPDSIEPHHAYL